MVGFAFTETMAGCLRLEGGVERAMSFTVHGRSGPLLGFLRRPEIAIEGEIDARGFADHRLLRGSIDPACLFAGERRVPYAFDFTANDGAAYSFAGHKKLAPGDLVESLTLLAGSVRDAGGGVVGRAVLRFDIRSDFVRYLKSFRREV